MYFSYDYETYYVTLLRYDFSQISFKEFVMNPDIYRAQLAFLPLNDIENIYENIRYSFSNVNQTAGKTTYNYELPLGLQKLEYQPCAVTTNVPGQLCKGDGDDKHSHGEACSMKGDKRATPGYSITDTRPCYGEPGSSAPGGGGSVGSPGGGGGYVPVRPNPNPSPIKSIPIKIKEWLKIIRLQISIGNTDKNLDVLKGILENNLATLQDLHSKANDTREHGNMFIKVKKNGKYTPLANQTALQLENGSNWALNIKPAVENPFNTGILHTHTNKNTVIYVYNEPTIAVPMLSHTDIQALFFLSAANSGNDKQLSESFFGLMTGQNLYVIMFHNDATLTNFFSKYGKHFANMRVNTKLWTKIERELKDEYSKITSISSSINPALEATMYEKALLTVLKDNNLSLNFYRLDANNGQFNGSWKLLGLDASGNVTENQGH